MNFYFFNLSGLSCLNHWNCKVDESISHFIKFTFFQVFDKLNCLESSNTTCCCRESRCDSSCFEFGSHPIHWLKFVVTCS